MCQMINISLAIHRLQFPPKKRSITTVTSGSYYAVTKWTFSHLHSRSRHRQNTKRPNLQRDDSLRKLRNRNYQADKAWLYCLYLFYGMFVACVMTFKCTDMRSWKCNMSNVGKCTLGLEELHLGSHSSHNNLLLRLSVRRFKRHKGHRAWVKQNVSTDCCT